MKNTLIILIILLSCLGQTAFGKTAQEYYNRGEMFFKQGNYESALDSFNLAIEAAKQSGQLHPRAHLLRGVIYQDVYKNYRQAISDYKAYLTKPDADKNTALKRLAKAYFDLGMLYRSLFNTAVNIEVDYYTYKLELVALLPDAVTSDDMPYLRYFRGLCYYLSGRFDEGIADLKQVTKQAPIYNLAQLKLAACYYRNGQKKQAEQIFAQMQRSIDKKTEQSHSVMLNSELWRTYLELNKLENIEQALQACEKSVNYFSSRKPVEVTLLNRAGRNLSYVYYCKGDMEQALAKIEPLDLTVPDFVATLSELLKKRLADSKSADPPPSPPERGANKNVHRTFEVSYYDPSIFQQQSHIYLQLTNKVYTEMLPFLDQQNTKLQIGLCYLHSNQLEKAIPIFDELRQTKGGDKFLTAQAAIYLGIGKYLSDRKNGSKFAGQIWDDVLNNFKGDKDVFSEMAYHWAELGINLKESLQLYTKLGINLPEASEIYIRENFERHRLLGRQLGYVYLQLGIHEKESNKRIQFLTNATLHLEKNHLEVGYIFDDPTLLVDLAQSYYHKRYFDVSANIFMNFLSKYPEVIQIINALQIVSEIATGVWPLGQMPNPQWVNLNYY